MPAHADEENNEFRLTALPTYALTQDRRWIGVGYLGYVWSNDKDYDVDDLGLGVIWRFAPKMETWFEVIGSHTDNETSPDVDEVRPVVRFRNYFTKTRALRFYNMARLEYRIQDSDGGDDTEYLRFRDRVGVEFALGPKGGDSPWYGIADVEAFYRFDKEMLDPFRMRVGLGWIIHDLVHAELSYYMQFTRGSPGDSLEWTENIWRLNFKVARQRGLLEHVFLRHSEEQH